VFPGCSQDPTKKAVTLGTSVGWSDVYPATYHENWIDVTGLRGCFAFVHRADPANGIFELNETNNDSQRIVRLPFGRRHARCP
jgi:subtilase family serine protease